MKAERVIIVGAGPAGLSAALKLVRSGIRPTLVDEAAESGGQIFRRQPKEFKRSPQVVYGFDAKSAIEEHRKFDEIAEKIETRLGTMVCGIENQRLYLFNGAEVDFLDFDRLILATGAFDTVIPLPGWTLPGVFTLGGAQVSLKTQGCAVGKRIVFLGASPLLPYTAFQYCMAGAEVGGILETTSLSSKLAALPEMLKHSKGRKGVSMMAKLVLKGIPLRLGVKPLRIEGNKSVKSLVFLDSRGRENCWDCDAVIMGYGFKSENQLADLAGCRLYFEAQTNEWRVENDGEGRTTLPYVYVAGDGNGVKGWESARIEGEIAANSLLKDLNLVSNMSEEIGVKNKLKKLSFFRKALDRAFPYPHHLAAEIEDSTIVCRCELISAGEIRQASKVSGEFEINRIKSFCRVGMGRCQGRICGSTTAEILRLLQGTSLEAVGHFRAQSPVKPIPTQNFCIFE